MVVYKEPLEVQCSWCKKKFGIAYVIASKNYSKKNNWGFWTEKEENKDKEICNACLLDLYWKRRKEFRKLVDERKKKTFRVYLSNKKFY